ncbi:MAG TPA: nucleotide sugar dehydrogenase [Chthoniobacterales bacterium]|jgi:UDP-N-acetyl-D-mannosaminuronic acid dehydrogenase|nr:nucleotide sugar dehydrogenase [Chthoniobacterales bacterium]
MTKENRTSGCDVCVVGGAGRVGLPLALVLADSGLKTLILDINKPALKKIAEGTMPFREEGGEALLKKVHGTDRLTVSSEANNVGRAELVVLTIGTPVDEFQNPNLSVLTRCLDELIPHLRDGQTIILRSTVAPGTTDYIDSYLGSRGKKIGLAFCPERVVQGKGIEEIRTLPQLVSGTSQKALAAAKKLFAKIASEVVEMTPLEAEFAKLVCNAFRYMQFAATNQLYMVVESAGLNYGELLSKMKQGYPRMGSIPGPGFAAGPCLMKDTMQLFAFQKHNFVLGQMATIINEGLPNFIVEQLARRFDLREKRVGILGMAFKADSDDIRDSLSYKLGKLLRFHGAKVFYSDEYAKDPTFVDKETLVSKCDVIIVGVPHSAYQSLEIPKDKDVVDLWSTLPRRTSASAT